MAPVSGYFGGHGSEVMKNMMAQYGKKKGKRVFYATANKRKKKGLHDRLMDMHSSKK